jgi:hypothetical protein
MLCRRMRVIVELDEVESMRTTTTFGGKAGDLLMSNFSAACMKAAISAMNNYHVRRRCVGYHRLFTSYNAMPQLKKMIFRYLFLQS